MAICYFQGRCLTLEGVELLKVTPHERGVIMQNDILRHFKDINRILWNFFNRCHLA